MSNDPYERRKDYLSEFFPEETKKNYLCKLSPEETKKVLFPQPSEENYEEEERLPKEGGRKVPYTFAGKSMIFWMTQRGSWCSGNELTIVDPYRLFEETEDEVIVRKTTDHAEIKSMEEGVRQEMRRILGKS